MHLNLHLKCFYYLPIILCKSGFQSLRKVPCGYIAAYAARKVYLDMLHSPWRFEVCPGYNCFKSNRYLKRHVETSDLWRFGLSSSVCYVEPLSIWFFKMIYCVKSGKSSIQNSVSLISIWPVECYLQALMCWMSGVAIVTKNRCQVECSHSLKLCKPGGACADWLPYLSFTSPASYCWRGAAYGRRKPGI